VVGTWVAPLPGEGYNVTVGAVRVLSIADGVSDGLKLFTHMHSKLA
jgi:hypothetical protein